MPVRFAIRTAQKDPPHYALGGAKGPYYNVYSKALHSFGERVYAFAFDDAVGEDSTLHSSDDGRPPALNPPPQHMPLPFPGGGTKVIASIHGYMDAYV